MQGTWACLIPFVIVIPISMLSKKVQPGLFCGLLVGSYLMYPSILGGVEHMITYLVKNIVKTSNIEIIFFLYGFAGLVGMIKYAGGIKGFVHLISGKVKTKRSALLLAWIAIFGTFSEPDFSIVTRGSILKPIINRLDMSKKRVGYAIEFTANPLIAMIPVATAFVGYMVSIIGQSLHGAHVHGTPYTMYVKSIPFNFFSIVIMLVGIYYSFFKKTKDVELEAGAGGKTDKNKKKDVTTGGGGQPIPQPANAQQTPPSGGQPALNMEMGSEMPTGDESKYMTEVQAHLMLAQIDLAQADIRSKQALQTPTGDNSECMSDVQAYLMQAQIDLELAEVYSKQATQNVQPQSNEMGSADQTEGDQQPSDNSTDSSAAMQQNAGPNTFMSAKNSDVEMSSDGTMDLHGNTTGVFEHVGKQEDPDGGKDGQTNPSTSKAFQKKEMNEAHRAYVKETPSRATNLIIPIGLFLTLTLFLSYWNGHSKAHSFFGAFIKSNMLMVMLTSLMIAIIVGTGYFLFQKLPASQLATHFIKGGNELVNVLFMLTLIWALTAVSQDLGFSHFISSHVKGWIPHLFIAPSLFALGVIISYFIGSSWGTWGLLMPLGITLAAESHTSILLAIGAVFASGTFGAFCSPLSDNTVTTCTVLDLPVTKYARSKLEPALIAAAISFVLFGVFSFFMK